MTTGAGVVNVGDCPSQTVVARWTWFALFLPTLIIVRSCGTVLGYIGTLSTECSWWANVTYASVLTKEGRIGTRTVSYIVAINVRLSN